MVIPLAKNQIIFLELNPLETKNKVQVIKNQNGVSESAIKLLLKSKGEKIKRILLYIAPFGSNSFFTK